MSPVDFYKKKKIKKKKTPVLCHYLLQANIDVNKAHVARLNLRNPHVALSNLRVMGHQIVWVSMGRGNYTPRLGEGVSREAAYRLILP